MPPHTTRQYYFIFVIILLLALAHAFHYYPQMPDIIGQRYSFSGTALSCGSKNTLMTLYLSVILIPVIMFVFISKAKLETSKIPNRNYWIKNENISKARAIFARCMFKFTVGFMLFWIAFFNTIFTAGMNDNHMDNVMIVSISVMFSIFIVLWIIDLFQAFKIPTKDQKQENS